MGNAFKKTRAPRLIAFNLDNTLIHPTTMHPIEPYVETLSRVLAPSSKELYYHEINQNGRTDRQIFRDLAKANNVELTDEQTLLAAKELPNAVKDFAQPDGKWTWEALPGAPRLLRSLYSRTDSIIAIITGNEQYVAGLKMDAAGLFPIFFEHEVNKKKIPMGAFGTDSENREDLFPILLERYTDYLEIPLEKIVKDDVIIVGNSPQHIEQAHAYDFACLAVATGDYSVEELGEAEVIFHDLSNMHVVQGCLLTTLRERDDEEAGKLPVLGDRVIPVSDAAKEKTPPNVEKGEEQAV